MESEVKGENKKSSKILVGVLIAIIVLLVAALVYFVFIKDDKTEESKEEQNNQQVATEEVKYVSLNNQNQEVEINNKKVNLKVVESALYVNDTEYGYINPSGGVYVTSQYALVADNYGDGLHVDYAIDENGKIINVFRSVIEDSSYSSFEINNIRSENGKVVAHFIRKSCSDIFKNCDNLVEFNYNGDYIIVKDMALKDGIKALTKYTLTKSNISVDFNGSKVKLRADGGKIYFNDKLVKELVDFGSYSAFVSEKLILIDIPGAQCTTVFVGAINENSEYIEIDNDNNYPIYGLYSKDGVIMGTGYECIMTEEDTDFNAKFVYDGTKVKLTKTN